MKEIRFVMMGFGNVGKAVSKILMNKDKEIQKKCGCEVKVTGIVTSSRGNLYAEEGIDLSGAISDLEEKGMFSESTEMSGMEILEKGEYDCVIEMSPLNIFTGQPATEYILTAMDRGKHAITANKGPIAWHYTMLKEKAAQKNVGFFYETVVMDGTPVFNLAEHNLKMAKVTAVEGILNTTTNFILDQMAEGIPMDEIMAEGRRIGFVEADPAMDIEGYDAAAKVTALLNVLMDAGITPDMVERKGIEDITYDDIKMAAERGNVIKLICRGSLAEEGNVTASVGPEEVSKEDMFASITGTTSVVSITTDMMKKISVIEHDPEIEQTAYGVFGDMIRVIERG